MIRGLRSIFLTALVVCAVPVYAQLTRGFISGTVQDSSNALVEGVTVTITNLATGIKRDGVTNSVGVYRFVAVEPGTYSVEFARAGFEGVKIAPVEVTTAQEVVLNQTLAVATVSTTLEVQETPPGVELQKSTPTIDKTLTGEFVRDLPTTAGTRGDAAHAARSDRRTGHWTGRPDQRQWTTGAEQ